LAKKVLGKGVGYFIKSGSIVVEYLKYSNDLRGQYEPFKVEINHNQFSYQSITLLNTKQRSLL